MAEKHRLLLHGVRDDPILDISVAERRVLLLGDGVAVFRVVRERRRVDLLFGHAEAAHAHIGAGVVVEANRAGLGERLNLGIEFCNAIKENPLEVKRTSVREAKARKANILHSKKSEGT